MQTLLNPQQGAAGYHDDAFEETIHKCEKMRVEHEASVPFINNYCTFA